MTIPIPPLFPVRQVAAAAVLAFTSGMVAPRPAPAADLPPKPNIIFILADDLGYGDLGCFGSEKIKTPQLDRLAGEGMRLTDFYAGAPVCAPSRCVLMTGMHTGRCWVRGNGNADAQTLRAGDLTIAEILKEAGYATALCGKWGLGELGSEGHPNRQGFDHFFGYLSQHHAHNYYPTFLIRNAERVPLRNVAAEEGPSGAGWASRRVDYSHDLVMEDALTWLESVRGRPFFLYLALTIPHANNEGTRGTGNGQEVPDYGIYAERDWPDPDKGQAAMITRMDRDVGVLMAKLKEWGLDETTLVVFSSDNGHHREGGNNPELFDANGPLRGMKRDLYEGGIRVPTIAWWPGVVPAGSRSGHPAYFGDFLATVCDLVGEDVPPGTQSISFLPTLAGRPSEQEQHRYLYWEFYEQGGKQAVRFGRWKAVRMPMFTGPIELYDLESDLGEATDVSSSHPEVVEQAAAHMKDAHVGNPNWSPGGKLPPRPEPGDGRMRF